MLKLFLENPFVCPNRQLKNVHSGIYYIDRLTKNTLLMVEKSYFRAVCSIISVIIITLFIAFLLTCNNNNRYNMHGLNVITNVFH